MSNSDSRVITLKQTLFVRSAVSSGLVSQRQIEQALETLRASGGLDALPAVSFSEERLGLTLVELGMLTQYQVQQLKAGRTKLHLGPYVITDWLGQGGMGQVFVAVHQMMGRQVAIKVLPRSKSTPEAIASFTREIQTQAKLDHRNLVRAYDAGHDGNVYFLVTEYVPGTDLRRLVRSQGRLTMAQASSVINQAALGLGYAHSQGLVHRDVKPGNLLVTPEGLVKVSDLGLAGFLHEGNDDPRAGKIVGTADYLAPEKITQPHFVSAVSDIYALGCTLYYAVTGKVPFPGGSTRDKARRHCEETPWHPRQFNPDVTDDFIDLIADMMEKDPQHRIQSAAEVVQRLAPWVESNTELPHPDNARMHWHAPPIPVSHRDETIDDLGELTPSTTPPHAEPTGSVAAAPAAAARPAIVVNRPPASPAVGSKLTLDDAGAATRKAVVRALAIAIPTAMAVGGLFTYVILELWR
jgi:serine/threonine protein kinase